MPRIPSSRQISSRTLAPYRETAESKARRRRNYPNDCYLDFDTQILAMFWTKDGAVPGQVTVYPRDDLRVRLSDHKIALAEAGFEMNDRGIHVFVPAITNMDGGCADCACAWGWAECGWDTPLRVHATGDAILLSSADDELVNEVSAQLVTPGTMHTPIAGPSRIKGRALKRKAKQRLKVHGDDLNDPLLIATSDPDYDSDSSDVVIVRE
ncbi:hypothetical protein B0H19DRAFT_1082493 [Mycena capillaripes]|nr:hypothetical protein B0H19DRAFT_1082493 [Mycena capillaripes]